MIEDLHFDDNYRNVGVKLSGGADSAIVYYAVCDYYKDKPDTKVYAMTMGTKLKPWYPTGAKKLIDFVETLTGVRPADHYIHYQPDHVSIKDGEPYASGINDMDAIAVEKFDLDAIYSGLTINPPEQELITYFQENDFGLDFEWVMGNIEGRDKDRDTTEEPTMFTKRYGEKRVDRIRPFINKNKRAVHTAYEIHNMMDVLYPQTYSCETVPADYDNMDFVHCGHCFFCLERWWGFGRIV